MGDEGYLSMSSDDLADAHAQTLQARERAEQATPREEFEQAIRQALDWPCICTAEEQGRDCPEHGQWPREMWVAHRLLDSPDPLAVLTADLAPHDPAVIAAWGVEQGREQVIRDLRPLLDAVEDVLRRVDHRHLFHEPFCALCALHKAWVALPIAHAIKAALREPTP